MNIWWFGVLRPRRGAAATVTRLVAIGAALFGVAGCALLVDAWIPLGHAPDEARRTRMRASPQFRDGVFANKQAMFNDWLDLTALASPEDAKTTPTGPIPIVQGDGRLFETPPELGLRVTWMGHSSILVELDGQRVLFDPVFVGRASPFDWVGPERWYDPPVPLEHMPKVDAVAISHDHYDHLSQPTLDAMKDWDTRFIAPLGVGAHLAYWGIPEDRIVEVDWGDEVSLGGVRLIATESRHASGRHLFDQMRTLWAGYALIGPEHRAFYSGDTGLFYGLADIGERYGPFDVTMIEIGAYHRAWPDWHMGPEQAVRAHQMLRGEVLLPVHWGLWNLALHGWTEPAERVLVAAHEAGVKLALPRPGESVEPKALQPLEKWWPDLPWQTAAQHPIRATKRGDPNDRM